MLKARLVEKGEASNLFGQERTDQLIGILGSIEQTFGGEPLYPSIEEKAAHLLYFVIKDHPFPTAINASGPCLSCFCARTAYLEDANGMPKINDNALVALALLTAERTAQQGPDDPARHEPNCRKHHRFSRTDPRRS
jgi:hypothetical protein